MKLQPPIRRLWTTPGEVDVDLFAGGGGASDGKRRATGRSPHVAVNHWPTAIAMHTVNHPDCEHFTESVYKVQPLTATRGRRVRQLWASPTCTHFSRAKGASLKDRKIRGLAWCIMPWIIETRPEVIIVENVVEFMTWGPLHREHLDECVGDMDGEGCLKDCRFGKVIKSRAGETYRAWKRRIQSFGYSIEERVLKAWEYGAPTTRERVYIVMRADGLAAQWPIPTHTKETWRTAAEIIDWSIPCPSVFDRKKPHVPATRRRLAKGLRKFVLEAKRPFLMHLTHGAREHSIDEPVRTVTCANRGEQAVVAPMIVPVKTWGGGGNEARSAELPFRTVTASDRGEHAIAAAYMIHRSNGERDGQEPRVYDVRAPHPTVVAGGVKTSPVVAFLAKNYSERPTGGWNGGASLEVPIHTVTSQDHHSLVAASTIKFYGTSTGQPVDEPIDTVTGQGSHHGVVAASLIRYNGQSVGQVMDAPISTVDTRDRFALVEAAAAEWNDIIAAKARRVYRFLVDEGHEGPWLDHSNQVVRIPGTDLVVYDVGMRMLVPRELFRANGFRDSYVIELIGPNGKPLTKTEQIRLVGNSVCPDVAEALVRCALAGPLLRPRARLGQMSLALEAA